MDLTTMRLVTDQAAVNLSVVGADSSSPFMLKQVIGLGPPEVAVYLAETRNAGSQHRGRRPLAREIIARVGLNPNYAAGQSAGDLRTYFYGLLSAGDQGDTDVLTVELYDANTSGVWAKTKGYVKRIEAAHFTKDPEVQVTITCLKPFLESPIRYIPPDSIKLTPVIMNTGSAPTGFRAELTFNKSISKWALTNSSGQSLMFQNGFADGDKLVIDTRAGRRQVLRYRDGELNANLLAALSNDSTWLMLRPGNNVLTPMTYAVTWDRFFYVPQHWGI